MGDNLSHNTSFPSVELLGFENKSLIDQLGDFFFRLTHQLIEHVDVELLESVTFAINTEHYLAKIKANDIRYTPSNDAGVGVAKTISRINGDWRKNQIIINCEPLGLHNLLNEFRSQTTNEIIQEVIGNITYLLFHEMCHVSHNKILLNKCPDLLTKESFANELQAAKHTIALACWDEFYVCSMSNKFGADQEDNYREILINTLNDFEAQRDSIFKQYMLDSAEHDENAYSNLFNRFMQLTYSLFKYCGYYSGDLIDKENAKLDNSIFNYSFSWVIRDLIDILYDLDAKSDDRALDKFEIHKIGELVEKFAQSNGLVIRETEHQGLFINLDRETQVRIMI